jgi:hypothetical protein
MARKAAKSAQAKQKVKKDPACPHCRGGAETFRYMKRNYLFDVDQARKLVQDGREPVELDDDDVRHSVDISRIYPEHLPHVDTRYPGIIAHLWYQQPDGELIHGHLLIDGHHRAARCLQLQQPFFVHILTEDESRAILLKAPAIREPEPALV